MAVALEVRAPLLDRSLVALACRLPPASRVAGAAGKAVLRAAARGLVPDAIIDRPKHGFAIPVAAWLRGPLAGWAADLTTPRALDHGLLDVRAVARLVDQHRRGRVDHRKKLWTLLAFQAWWLATRERPA
jgi:asparagine synthase (glutamine-hydrolysing)